ncbi:hypothetical protein K7X08_008184 [Anisodus acutangulus]|uniref:Uncharacterized protein n=1 Tax=Anisodus acutangulus TaxID=402998 RepID=A0A9Q1MQM3_9SOLA|nr:hypothetical protein K7X08_008184 [Anisodus acutangulus]
MDVSVRSAVETANVTEVVKPKGRGGPKQAPAKAKSIAVEDDEEDDDEVLALKDRLAAYNLNSSPDRSEAHMLLTMRMSFEFEPEVAVEAKKKGGRKPATTKVAAAAAKPPKKRAPANKQSQSIGQRLITEVLKPAEDAGVSPDRKVRKMRESPFNKKSGAVLQSSVSSLGSLEEVSSEAVVAPKARPQRVNRGKKTTCVISDSDT